MPTPLSRRAWLSTAGLLGLPGTALAQAVDSSDNSPAAQVGDRTSRIKLTAIEALPTGRQCFVRLSTNLDVDGWGEITGLDPRVAATLVTALFDYLEGENPTRIEHLWQKVHRGHRDIRGGTHLVNCLAALDMALWDITGKLWGVPIYRLLGGPTREKIRAYPHPQARRIVVPGPHPFSAGPAEIGAIVALVAQAREELGREGTIILDAAGAIPPPMLIQLANALEPWNVLFIAEAAIPGNIAVFKRLKEASRVPLAAGARLHTIWNVLPLLHERCLDVLQPECVHAGGITQLKKMATLAEPYLVPLAPRCATSPLGMAASLHASASIPLFLIHEWDPTHEVFPDGVIESTVTLDREGYLSLPEGPGLGVTIRPDRLAQVDADPRWRFKWPENTNRDGSVRDE